MKKTKIICTIGPSSCSKSIILELLKNGMDSARLNFSHGCYENYKIYINNLNWASKKINKKICIILDTKGPEIRTLKLYKNNEVLLKRDQYFSFVCNDINLLGNINEVAVNYENLFFDINIGNYILVDDGLISMIVLKKINNRIICKVLNDGILGENKSINLPGINISLPYLSEKDKKDLIFGCKNNIDFVAASFVRNENDVLKIRKFLDNNKGKNIKIISKIENREGLLNFDKILNVSDGIMIARGDLGVEIPVEDVIFNQKIMIKKCNLNNKFVITATQMLESMIKNPRPTRAEAGDVANAILDGTDAVMLSGESAKGNYPIDCVKIMSIICKRSDFLFNNLNINYDNDNNYYKNISINEAICKSSVDISIRLNSPLILVYTINGKSPFFIRKYFPKSMILALTNNNKLSKQLILIKGVIPLVVKDINNNNDFYNIGKKLSISKGYANIGDIVIMISGVFSYGCNTLSVHNL